MRAKDHTTNASDYQRLPQSIGVMTKTATKGTFIPPHKHERDQLLFARTGIMRAETSTQSWIVPADRAIYIPANTVHSVTMRSDVEMRTLYISPGSAPELPKHLIVLRVTNLLRELIIALSNEEKIYKENSRAGHIAKLIESEIGLARQLPLHIPLPNDKRLQKLCTAIFENPASRLTLDKWSEKVGGSPRTLARLFEKELGMSFNKWRQRVRFYNAFEALSSGEPVATVANKNGYNSASAFSSAFFKAIGQRPSEIKEQAGN